MGELRDQAVLLTVAVGVIVAGGLVAALSAGTGRPEAGGAAATSSSSDTGERVRQLTSCGSERWLPGYCETVETVVAEHVAVIEPAELTRAVESALAVGVEEGADEGELERRAIAAVLTALGDPHARYRRPGEEAVLPEPTPGAGESIEPAGLVGDRTSSPVVARTLDERTGYLRPGTFADATPGVFRARLGEQLAQGVDGIVLDLRGNRGGPVRVARDIADELLPAGVAFTVEYRDTHRSLATRPGGAGLTVGLVVLVDEETASAAEMLAAALREERRATIVGRRTAGKATVQASHSLATGGLLRLTIGRWVTRDGASLDGVGLAPDITVEPPGDVVAPDQDPVIARARGLLDAER